MSEVFQPVRDVSGSPASATGAIATSPTDTALSLGPGGAPRADSGPFPDASARRRYGIVLAALVLLAGGVGLGPLAGGHPMPARAAGCWPVAGGRGAPL